MSFFFSKAIQKRGFAVQMQDCCFFVTIHSMASVWNVFVIMVIHLLQISAQIEMIHCMKWVIFSHTDHVWWLFFISQFWLESKKKFGSWTVPQANSVDEEGGFTYNYSTTNHLSMKLVEYIYLSTISKLRTKLLSHLQMQRWIVHERRQLHEWTKKLYFWISKSYAKKGINFLK